MNEVPEQIEVFGTIRKEQEKKGAKLKGKVLNLSQGEDALVSADTSAKVVLEDYKKAKNPKDGMGDLLKDDIVGSYLEANNITTVESYVELAEGEKAEMAIAMPSLKEKLDKLAGEKAQAEEKLSGLRSELGIAVKNRADAKNRLQEELQKNDPTIKQRESEGNFGGNMKEKGSRTFKGLVEGAKAQEKDIPEKELAGLVDQVVATGEESVRNYLVQVYEKGSRDYPPILSQKDVIKLGEYGPDFKYKTQGMFIVKMREKAIAVYDEWFEKTGKSKINPEYKDNRRAGLLDRINREWRDAIGKVENLDQAVYRQERAKKFEQIKPEVDIAFADMGTIILSNPYGHLVKGFWRNGEPLLVDFKPIDKDSPLAKYFSKDIDGRNLSSLDMNWLSENLAQIEADIATAETNRDDAVTSRGIFESRSIYKIFHSKEGREKWGAVQRNEKTVTSLNNAKILLSRIYKFMEKLAELEKTNDAKLNFHQDSIDLTGFKEAYFKALQEKLK